MKYKLINKTTLEEHLCDKVVIDGWDYYVSDEIIKVGDYYIAWETISNIESNYIIQKANDSEPLGMYSWADNYKKVIATNNLDIDIPQILEAAVRRVTKELLQLSKEQRTKTLYYE